MPDIYLKYVVSPCDTYVMLLQKICYDPHNFTERLASAKEIDHWRIECRKRKKNYTDIFLVYSKL